MSPYSTVSSVKQCLVAENSVAICNLFVINRARKLEYVGYWLLCAHKASQIDHPRRRDTTHLPLKL